MTQFSVEKEPPLVDDALLALLSSLFLSRGRLQALPSVLACVHGPTYPLVFVTSPLPLCFFVRYTSSFVMHPGSGLCFFHDRRLNHTIRPSTAAPPSLPPNPAYTPGALSTHQLSTTYILSTYIHACLTHGPKSSRRVLLEAIRGLGLRFLCRAVEVEVATLLIVLQGPLLSFFCPPRP